MHVFRRALAPVILSIALASPVLASGLSGAYLAGRHAAAMADVDKAGQYLSAALARDPNNLGLMEQAMLYQASAGRVAKAVPLARRLIERAPAHRMANLILTVDAFHKGDYADAATRIAATPEAYHPLVGALMSAWAEYAQGRGEAAFDGLADKAIFRIFGGYHKGLMRAAAGDLEGAAAAFETTMKELSAPTGRMAQAYGAVLRRLGQTDRAREIYEKAIGVSVGDGALEAELRAMDDGAVPDLPVNTPEEGAAEALFGLASALTQDGEGRLSLFYARLALFLRPDFGDARLLAAEVLEKQEQFALAAEVYAGVPADGPLGRSAEIGRAGAFIKMGEEDRAVEVLTSLTRRDPGAVDAQLALGDLMRRLKEYTRAARAYDAAAVALDARGRKNWVVIYQRGISYERSGEWEKAEADFHEALELKPDQPLVLNYLGYSWLERGMKLDLALDYIRKAVEQRPDDGYIVDSLGWAHYLRNEFPDAVRELERAVELRPVDAVINDHLGDALWRVGRRLEAEFQWRRAMSFDPEEEDLARIKRKLKVGLDVVLSEEKASGGKKASVANDG